jgi:hypothetical protein
VVAVVEVVEAGPHSFTNSESVRFEGCNIS